MTARIYSPAKNPLQSGRGKLDTWILEYEPTAPRTIDPLMGWTSSADTKAQLKMTFRSKEAAIQYATDNNIEYSVEEPKVQKRIIRSYSANFDYNRREPWSH